VAGPLVRDLGAPFGAVWKRLIDVRGPAEATRHFARVLGAIVALGQATVAARLETALATDTPLGLALAPAVPPPPTLPLVALPPSVHDTTVTAARAADYDALLGARS
jgi:hypothetical protein